MRLRALFWFALSILFFLGAAWFWQKGQERARTKSSAPTSSQSSGTETRADATSKSQPGRSSTNAQPLLVQSASMQSLAGSVAPRAAAAADPLHPHRLSNTTQSLSALMQSEQTLLLANALIDTRLPLDLSIPPHLRAAGDPGRYIVQARGNVTDAFREQLEEDGASIVSYIPHNAFLVQVDRNGAAKLEARPETRTVVPWEPYFKIAEDLLPLAIENTPLKRGTMLSLLLFPGTEAVVKEKLAEMNTHIFAEDRTSFGPVYKVSSPADALADLARIDEVQALEPVYWRQPANDIARSKLFVSTNSIVPNNYRDLTGEGVTVNINDTGVELSHPDLIGRVFGPANSDFNGHGTHVAGSIASTGENGPPGETVPGSATNANYRGMAPAAELYSLPIGLTTGPLSSDSALQERAAGTNAYISNNSWTYGGARTYSFSSASWDEAVRDALPGQEGSQPLVVVVAAGDSGNGLSNGSGGSAGTVESPATAKNVITVGAVEMFRNITNQVVRQMETNMPWLRLTDSSNQVASFSSRGNVGVGVEGDFGRFKPDLVTPGTFVVSTRSSEWTIPSNSTTRIVDTIQNQTLQRDETNSYSLFIPDNAVSLQIRVRTNRFTGDPLPTMFIHARDGFFPTAADFKGTNDVTFPVFSDVWTYTIGSTNRDELRFEVQSIITLTNDDGNYFQVLDELNQPLEPYYRYESGTSMSAAMVSGMLALMQEHFEKEFNLKPSPALMKALLINGARTVSDTYSFQADPIQNIQGWGMPNLTNSLPLDLSAGPLLFVDQAPTNALVTGERHVRTIDVSADINEFPLRVSLVWTDPPGNPVSGIKLVNDLDLIVSEVVSTNNGVSYSTNAIFVGNNFSGGRAFSEVTPVGTNVLGLPTDRVNNVENVYIQPPLASRYVIEVVAKKVNVNAVTDQTVGIMQDYALVMSSGTPGPNTAAPITIASQTSGFDPFPSVQRITNGVPLLDQRIGANSPLLTSTNGVTNQWNFYVLTNNFMPVGTNAMVVTNGGPYVAFTTFLPPNISRPRFFSSDIDLYVTMDSSITNLNEAAIANAFKSTSRGGTESVIITNSPDTVWYAGIKSEDQQGATYGFFGIATDTPFSSTDDEGNVYVVGVPIGADIPDGTAADPGAALVFAFVPEQIMVRNVIVTNVMSHQLGTDLLGNLSHNQQFSVLYNNDLDLQNIGIEYVFDDSDSGTIQNSSPTTGPGSLRDFVGEEGTGVWQFTVVDSIPNHTGRVESLLLKLEPEEEAEEGLLEFENVTILGNRFFYAAIDAPADATRLEVCIINNSAPVEVYIREGAFPSLTQFDTMASFDMMGGCVDLTPQDSPPLTGGRYFIGIYNPNAQPVNIGRITIRVERDLRPDTLTRFKSRGSTPLIDDAVTNSVIHVDQRRTVFDVKAGVRIDHDRPSDLVLHLVSPSGTRLLLAENRGYLNMAGYGAGTLVTNNVPTVVPGGSMEDINCIAVPSNEGVVRIDYNFLNFPDQLQVTYDGVVIYDTGLISGNGTFDVDFGPGVSNEVCIVMNPGGNNQQDTLWEYTPTILSGRYLYANFTEDPLFDPQLIKFAMPPFAPLDTTVLAFTNVVFTSDFEPPTAMRIYSHPELVDGWTVTNDFVQVLDDSGVVNANTGSQFLELDLGAVRREEPSDRLASYRLEFAHRTFDTCLISAWFGENNAADAVGSNHGSLEGDAGFVDGLVVDRAFNLDGDGDFVRIPASPTLDVGMASGFTVEGWVNARALDGTRSIFTWETGNVGLQIRDTITPGQLVAEIGELGGGLRKEFASAKPVLLDQYHHVALTFDIASGIAAIYLDGMLEGQSPPTSSFIPDTTTDLLLGAGAGGTTDFFDGILDEFRLYDCALSATEIMEVFEAGAAGGRKAIGAGEFLVTIDRAVTNLLSSRDWRTASIPFFAESNSVFIEIEGTAGINYFDSFELLEIKENNVYYLPEESISPFKGENAFGDWQLEIWDNRAGAAVEGGSLLSWQLDIVFANTNVPTVRLTNGIPYTTTVGGSNAACFQVFVPFSAMHATNFLSSETGGELDLVFNQTTVPGGGAGAGDIVLLADTVEGISVIAPTETFELDMTGARINPMSAPTLLSGLRYYLCVRNSDPSQTNEFTIWVDFDDVGPDLASVIPLENAVAHMNTVTTNVPVQYYSFDVSTNAYEVTFETLNADGDVNLFVSKGLPLPQSNNGNTYFASGTNPGTQPEFILVTDSTLRLLPGRYYLTVENQMPAMDVMYDVVATEQVLPFVTLENMVDHVDMTELNQVDYFVYTVSTNAIAVDFEVLGLTDDVDLYVRQTIPPLLGTNAPYFSSQQLGITPEKITVVPEDPNYPLQPGDWWLAITNVGVGLADYAVRVTEYTNAPFNLVTLSNGVPFMTTAMVDPLNTNVYRFFVSSNAVQANFEILNPTTDMDLQVGLGSQFLGLTNVLCPLIGTGGAGINEFYFAALMGTPSCVLMPGTDYYMEAINVDPMPGPYTIRATEFVPGTSNLVILSNGVEHNNTVSSDVATFNVKGTDYYQFTVPPNPLQIVFEILDPPTGNVDLFVRHGLALPTELDFDMASATFGAVGEQIVIGDTSAFLPAEAGIWYLGVTSQEMVPVSYNVRASVLTENDIVTLTNGVPFTQRLEAGSSVPFSGVDYYRFTVSANPVQAVFETFDDNGDVDLYLSRGLPLPTDTVSDLAGVNGPSGTESILVVKGGVPVDLLPGDWYLTVLNFDPLPVDYTVRVTEVRETDIVTLINGIPVESDLLPAGVANSIGIDYYTYTVSAGGIQASFDTFASNGDVDLYLKQGLPLPDEFRYDAAGVTPNSGDESIVLVTGGVPVALAAGDYHLAVVHREGPGTVVNYNVQATEIMASDIMTLTNGVGSTNTVLPPDGSNSGFQYFTFTTAPNAVQVNFEILGPTDNVDIFVKYQLPFPSPGNFDYASQNPGTQNELVQVATNSTPVPLTAGEWVVAVANRTANPVDYVLLLTEIYDTDIVILGSGQAGLTSSLTAAPAPAVAANQTDYYGFDVDANALQVDFQTLNANGDVDLYISHGLPLPHPLNHAAASAQDGDEDEAVYLYDGSSPVTLAPGRWYLAVVNREDQTVDYEVCARAYVPEVDVVTLTDGVVLPRTFTPMFCGPHGQIDYYRFHVSTNARRMQLEVRDPSVNVRLLVQRELRLPDEDWFQYASANTLPQDDVVIVWDDSSPEPLSAGDWYLGVVHSGSGPVSYDLLAREFESTGKDVSLIGFKFVNGELCLTFTNTLPGLTYHVQGTRSLTPIMWEPLSPAIVAVTDSLVYCVPLTSPFTFFQLAEGEPAGPPTARITTATSTPNGFLIEWVAPPNLNFSVEWNPDLNPGNWTAFPGVITSTGNLYQFLDDGSQTGGPPLPALRFYRVLQMP